MLVSMMVICHPLITQAVTTEYPAFTEYDYGHTQTAKTVEIPELFYPFGPDHGDDELPTWLDYSESVPISISLPFFTNNYSHLYVSYINTIIQLAK